MEHQIRCHMPCPAPSAEQRPGPLSPVQLLSSVSLARRQNLHWVLTIPPWTEAATLRRMGRQFETGSSIRRSHALPISWSLSRHCGVRSVAIRTVVVAASPAVSGSASAVAGSDLLFKSAFSNRETVAGPLHNETGEGTVAGSDLPFKGAFSAKEKFVVGEPLHKLTGEGEATHLGRFKIESDFNVTPPPVSATGTATWTASNHDQLTTSTAGTAVIAFPAATITETHTITGGTGRFAGASGTLIVERVLNLQSLASTATVSGSLTLDR